MSSHKTLEPRGRFRLLVAQEDEAIDLAEAALLIAAEEYPRLKVAVYLEKLDRFGDMARERAGNAVTAQEMISALNATLFEELGFRGNTEHYYDPRNSFLNEVIDRRAGIPITLTVIYMEVARRIGFPLHGVGMPRHFIAKYVDDNGEIFIDPFNRGQVLGEQGCAELLASASGGQVELRPEHLQAISKKQMLARMLSNLLGIYAASRDYSHALAIIELILILTPYSPPYVRDHGILLGALGKTGQAIRQLELYLKLAPDAEDSAAVQKQLQALKQEQARLN